jgi:hypothetical protein
MFFLLSSIGKGIPDPMDDLFDSVFFDLFSLKGDGNGLLGGIPFNLLDAFLPYEMISNPIDTTLAVDTRNRKKNLLPAFDLPE